MAGVGSIGGRVAGTVKRARDATRAIRQEILPPDDDGGDDRENFYKRIVNIDGVEFDMNAPRGTYLNILI